MDVSRARSSGALRMLRRLLAVGALCGLTGCARPDAVPEPVIRLVEEGVIGARPADSLFYVGLMTTDDHGRLYVTDPQSFVVHKYDASGRLIAQAGRRGEGPGAFGTRIRGLSVQRDTLRVLEPATRLVHAFAAEDLRFLERVRLPERVSSPMQIEADRSGTYYVSRLSYTDEASLVRLDASWRVMETMPLHRRRGHAAWDLVKYGLDDRGRVILAYVFRNVVEVHDPTSGRVRSFEVDRGARRPTPPPRKARTVAEQVDPSHRPDKVYTWNVAVDGRGHILLMAGEYARQPGREIYVYSMSGKYRTTLLLPDASRRLHVGSHDDLYVSGRDETLIRKYRMIYAAQEE